MSKRDYKKGHSQPSNPNRSRNRPKFGERKERGSYPIGEFDYNLLSDRTFMRRKKGWDSNTGKKGKGKRKKKKKRRKTTYMLMRGERMPKRKKKNKEGETKEEERPKRYGKQKSPLKLDRIYEGLEINVKNDKPVVYIKDEQKNDLVIPLDNYTKNDFDFNNFTYEATVRVYYGKGRKLLGSVIGKFKII